MFGRGELQRCVSRALFLSFIPGTGKLLSLCVKDRQALVFPPWGTAYIKASTVELTKLESVK